MAAFVGIIATIILVIGSLGLMAVLRGWVLSILWGWFMVPVFGLPVLNIPFAIGLALVVRLLTSSSSSKDDDKYAWTKPFLSPFAALLVGWIVLQFI